jgi:hypothetical protein
MVRGIKNTATLEQCIQAIQESRGLITQAARKLGMDDTTFHTRIKQYPELKKAVEDARYRQDDIVENMLFRKVDDGELTAVIFYLKTRCKSRGYSEGYQPKEAGAAIDAFLEGVRVGADKRSSS